MKEDKILDSDTNQKNTKHGRLSFLLFLWTLGFLGISYLFTLIPESWLAQLPDSNRALILGIPVLIILITSIGGMRNAILSIRKKEPWGYQKIIGLIGAILIVGTFILLIIANVSDLMKVY